MSHYEERLEADLDKIRQKLGALADDVGIALQNAMRALLQNDDEIAHETVLGDHPINRNSRALDQLCHAFIARHLPSAMHLRLISSIIRVNVALERIGDYSVTIAREALQMEDVPSSRVAQQFNSIAHQAGSLLHDAIQAFVDSNADSARTLMSIPEQIEHDMDSVYDNLIDSGKKRARREMVAQFVVFNLLKRVTDQAKNICDQTVFTVTGEIKPVRTFNILFVDETNSYLSQMAEAIARKRYPESGQYSSAGLEPAGEADPAMLGFLDDRGVDTSEIHNQDLNALQLDLRLFDIIVSLDKNARKYFPEIPFHTATLRWKSAELGVKPNDEAESADYEAAYRALTAKIDELMQLLVGDNAG